MKNLEALKNATKGVLVPIMTPFKENQEIDISGIKKLTRFLIDNGVVKGKGALILTGSSGECPLLSTEERIMIFNLVKEEAKDEVTLFGGCNHSNTREVIELVNAAEKAGLDGVMISPTYYWKPTDEEILTHYKAIAAKTNMGIMVYNNWFASQYDLSLDIIKKLVNEVPHIISLKENTTNLAKFAKVTDAVGDKIAVLNGNGPPNEPWTSYMGAKGFITAEACVIPRTFVGIYEAEVNNDYEKAKKLLKMAAPLLDFIFGGIPFGPDYIRRIKASMNFVGLPGGIPRLPLMPVDNEFKDVIKKIIQSCELDEVWNEK